MSTEAPNESTTPGITPAVGGNDSTTQAAADKAATTPQPEGGNQDAIDKIIQKRLERERKKWEAESEEKAKRARMDEADRLKADLADRDKRIAEAEAKALAAERIADLTGKVIDPKAALRLWDEDDTVDTFLKRHPYMAPTPAVGTNAASTGAPNIRGKLSTGNMTSEQIADLQKRALRGERITLS